MQIALATCAHLPEWEVDDAPFHDALRARGVAFDNIHWDDPDYDWATCDACLIRTTWDYQERRDEFLDWIDRVSALTTLFNPREVVHWNTHKSYLRDLADRGVRIAPTVWLPARTSVDLRSIVAERRWSRAFLKPAIGSTARETMRFSTADVELAQAQQHLDRMLASEDMLLQPYLASVETTGELSVIFIEDRITHMVRKIPMPGDYRTQDDFGASDEPITLTDDEQALAHGIVECVEGDLLYARVDFLRDEVGRLCVTELEIVEPSLFFRHSPHAADRLAEALCRRIAEC